MKGYHQVVRIAPALLEPAPVQGTEASPPVSLQEHRARWGAAAQQAHARAAGACLAACLVAGAALRLWHLNAVGYNSDEAVYAGQAAALAGEPILSTYFPIFRAHPMIFQYTLSLGYAVLGFSDLLGRLYSVAIGLATIVLVYRLGTVLYGRWTGVVAAAFLSFMPYHVIVSRQVLLDGPMTLFTTLALYLVARYALTQRPILLYATGASLGLVFLTKETGFVVAAAVYAFLALTPTIRLRLRDLILSVVCMMVPIVMFPVSIALAGRTDTAKSYLVWQLFRRPNHSWTFFPTVVPPAIGPLLIVVALLGLWLLRGRRTWRETLLLAWIVTPVVVFQLWPVKGFQYLLPAAPPLAILAARTLCGWAPHWRPLAGRRRIAFRVAAVAVVVVSLLWPTWERLQPSTSTERLAGAGGIPGGRETGAWIESNLPIGAVLVAIGPSMANLIMFYGHRQAYGLSVSPNPLHRNPSYQPVINLDNQIRNGEIQYLVWDAFTAARTPFFTQTLLGYVDKYVGFEVHRESMEVVSPGGGTELAPVIIVYEVRP